MWCVVVGERAWFPRDIILVYVVNDWSIQSEIVAWTHWNTYQTICTRLWVQDEDFKHNQSMFSFQVLAFTIRLNFWDDLYRLGINLWQTCIQKVSKILRATCNITSHDYWQACVVRRLSTDVRFFDAISLNIGFEDNLTISRGCRMKEQNIDIHFIY